MIRVQDLSTVVTHQEDCFTEVFPAISPLPQIRLLNESAVPSRVVAEHEFVGRAAPVCLYGLSNAEVGGRGFIRQENRTLFQREDCIPTYLKGIGTSGSGEAHAHMLGRLLQEDRNVVELSHPIFAILHPHLVYGHFLLEVVPKLFLVRLLWDCGVRYPVLIHHGSPAWVIPWFERLGLSYLYYDPARDVVRAPRVLSPGMMNVDYAFHPFASHAFASFVPPASNGAKRKAYVSRRNAYSLSGRKLSNLAEVEHALDSLGFDSIEPESTSTEAQLEFFASARILVGEYGSGLHNSVFAAAGTTVVSLNWLNSLQSRLCALRQQHLALIPDIGGEFVMPNFTQAAEYTIDIDYMAHILEQASGLPPLV